MIATIADRKKLKVGRIRAEIECVKEALAPYAAAHGGRFIVFGSVARGDMRHDSDLDILVDFPAEAERDARVFVERVCVEHQVKPDLHLASEASPQLLDRVFREGSVIR